MAQLNAARQKLTNLFNPYTTVQSTPGQPSTITSFFSNLGKGATNQTRGFFDSTPSIFGSTTTTTDFSSKMGTIGQIASYIIGVVIVILVLLVFVHFLISPIFQLHPGGPGVIPIPGGDDGELYWKDKIPSTITNATLPIKNQSFGYSMILDVFIENPLQFSPNFRILFRRSDKETPTNSITGGTIDGYLNNYNVAAALLSNTNDLLVSVLCTDNIPHNVQIENVPVQEPFRLGIIVMEKALEVYINGKLMKTETYSSPPKDVKGDIFPKFGSDRSVAKLRNLKIWNRVLTTSEMRYAKPAMSSAADFAAEPMQSSSSCAS
jgi:hypothetical protein